MWLTILLVVFGFASQPDWKTILSTVPATPSGAVSSAEVERVGEALRGATPYLGGGDPSQVEKNREMVRRAASCLYALRSISSRRCPDAEGKPLS